MKMESILRRFRGSNGAPAEEQEETGEGREEGVDLTRPGPASSRSSRGQKLNLDRELLQLQGLRRGRTTPRGLGLEAGRPGQAKKTLRTSQTTP